MSAGIDAIRAAVRPGDPNASEVRVLCDGVERLSVENTALAAALADIAGMRELPDGTWVADAECWCAGHWCSSVVHLAALLAPTVRASSTLMRMNMRRRCWEYLGQPDGGPEEWCPVCVAEVAWSAWKLGVLR